MGTFITLKVGPVEVDCGKNYIFSDHCPLFQAQDLTENIEEEANQQPSKYEAYCRPLGDTICRLELLGYTLSTVQREYSGNTNEYGDKIRRAVSFKTFVDIIRSINLSDFDGHWSDRPENQHIPPNVIRKLQSERYPPTQSAPDYWALDMLLEGLSPYAKLRLLGENPKNLSQRVEWAFGQIVEEEYAKREDFLRKLGPEFQFLVVTEGSSDSHILKKALDLLRPTYSDFFRFVDMEEGYPFTGTGNLHKFAQGLVSISVLNRVVIVYDNDTEGMSKYSLTKRLPLPKNMAVTRLPDIAPLRKFLTAGPHGNRTVNINGKAAAIECYLDHKFSIGPEPARARWVSYSDQLKQYHGALEGKEQFAKAFLKLRHRDPAYDFSKIELVLDHLYKICCQMAATGTPILL